MDAPLSARLGAGPTHTGAQSAHEATPSGLFVCFEGGEACGKTTQIAALDRHLRARGVEAVVTREPGGTDLGVALRRELLHSGDLAPRAEALLYAADRAQHVACVIEPALAAGRLVITDRYEDSSIAYQGAARGLGDEVAALSRWANGGLVPDLTILLDADPATVAARRDRDADRLEAEPLAFHRAVRAGFLALAAAAPERYLVLDALRPADDLAADIAERVDALCVERCDD